jgi:hypothetical protein
MCFRDLAKYKAVGVKVVYSRRREGNAVGKVEDAFTKIWLVLILILIYCERKILFVR